MYSAMCYCQCYRHQYFFVIMICSNVSPSQLTCPARNISPLRRGQDPRSLSVRFLSLSLLFMLALFGDRFIFYSHGFHFIFYFSHRLLLAARRRNHSCQRDRRSRSFTSGQRLRARSLMRTGSGHLCVTEFRVCLLLYFYPVLQSFKMTDFAPIIVCIVLALL